MITITNMAFGYRRRHSLFGDLSLTLPQGSIVGLLGRNGEGKSTLIKLISGQLLARQGELEVLGHDPRKREVSFLTQIYVLPEEVVMPAMKISAYFECYAPFYPNFSAELAGELIEDFGLSWEMILGKLSLGQRKKAAIAFALSLRTPLLIMDEPTNGLDIPSKSVFRRAVARCASSEQTFIISTHQVRDLEQLIDRILLLDGNNIICNESVGYLEQCFSFGAVRGGQGMKPLYSEASVVGEVGVFPYSEEMEGEPFSMELFFTAMVTEQERMRGVIDSSRTSNIR